MLGVFALPVAGGVLAACGEDPTTAAPAAPTRIADEEAGARPDGREETDAASPLKDGAADALVPRWSKQFGEASAKEIEGAKAVATDAAGNVIIVGDLWGAANFGGGVLTTAGAQDVFIAKLDPNGKHLWSKRFGDATSYQVCLLYTSRCV